MNVIVFRSYWYNARKLPLNSERCHHSDTVRGHQEAVRQQRQRDTAYRISITCEHKQLISLSNLRATLLSMRLYPALLIGSRFLGLLQPPLFFNPVYINVSRPPSSSLSFYYINYKVVVTYKMAYRLASFNFYSRYSQPSLFHSY